MASYSRNKAELSRSFPLLLNSILDADRALALWCGRALRKELRFDVEAFKNLLALRPEIACTRGGKPLPPER